MRARTLVRRFAVATCALGVFAGIAGGLSLGIWGIERRTATAQERFIEYEGAAKTAVFACPDGVVMDETFDFDEQCGDFDYADIRVLLQQLPAVEAEGRFTSAIAGLAPVGHPDQWTRVLVSLPIDRSTIAATGTPLGGRGAPARPRCGR